ncbi:E3 ubiquitin-protein ligase TRIM39-like [Rhineura floridana]|uniref:E3 ubiquitin-protein ligase TRIM39-like n=1 Tax=Rhineura floridana TaxID=261503 RepID=UPI002AC85C97|nr:E3 ubiquitin-protein ligase TRIM39-like [Rhineura floridana]
MASAPLSADVRKEAMCPICTEYLTDPVSVDCGHNFCRDCITKYYEIWKESGPVKCPLCKAKIWKGNFRVNWQLRSIAEAFRLAKENLCVKHKKELSLFCKEDRELVCVVCEHSSEHRSHTTVLIEDALQEYKASSTELQMAGGHSDELLKMVEKFKQAHVEDNLSADSLKNAVIKGEKVNVTLDPDTAHPCLILSEDLKSVRWELRKQDLPPSPERFETKPCVLGRERFTSGRHWWEVEVEGKETAWWSVGIAKDTVRRKGRTSLNPRSGIWAVGKAFGDTSPPYQVLVFTLPKPIKLKFPHDLKKIRVVMDYKEGWVDFYDADTEKRFYSFDQARKRRHIPFASLL